MAEPRVNVRITASDDGASSTVSSFDATLQDLESTALATDNDLGTLAEGFNEAGDAAENADEPTSRFVVTLGDVREIARNVAGAIRTAAETLLGFAAQAGEAERNTLRLNAAFGTFGSAASGITQSLLDFAAAQSKVTAVNDDVIASGIAQIAAFTKNEEVIKKATAAALDFAAATGVDVTTAFTLFAKAADGNVAALSRYNIKVDEAIPASERFDEVLRQIAENGMGGAAQAAADGYTGRIDRLKNSFGELTEAIGRSVTQSEGFSNFTSNAAVALDQVTESVDKQGGFFGALGALLAESAAHYGLISEQAAAAATGTESLTEASARLAAEIAKIEGLGNFATPSDLARLAQLRASLAAVQDETAALAEVMDVYGDSLLGVADATNAAIEGDTVFAQSQQARARASEELVATLDRLGVAQDLNGQKERQARDDLEILGGALAAHKISWEQYSEAVLKANGVLAGIPGTMEAVAAAAAKLGDELAAEGEARQAAFDQEDALAEALDESTAALERQGDAASEAASGWREFTTARSADPRTDLEIAEENLRTAKSFGSFITTIDGRGSLGAIQALERQVANARAAETNGGSGAGGTAPLTSSASGRLGGGSRTVDQTSRLR